MNLRSNSDQKELEKQSEENENVTTENGTIGEPVIIRKRKATSDNTLPSDDSPAAAEKDKELPAFESGGENGKYWTFTLDTGSHVHCGSKQEADEYERDFEAIITNKRSFKKKKDFLKYQSLVKKQDKENGLQAATPQKRKAEEEALTPEQVASIEKVKKRIDETKPKNAIFIKWKTTARSNCLLLVIRWRNANGKEEWTVKPQLIVDTLIEYLKDFEVGQPIINAALKLLKVAKRRDTFKGPNDTAGRTTKARKEGGKPTFWPDEVMWTRMEIPYQEFTSTADEKIWIEHHCEQMGKTLKTVLTDITFIKCFENAGHPNLIKTIMKPSNGLGFTDYVRDCIVKIQQVQNLNQDVILDDVRTLLNYLHDSDIGKPKYTSDLPNDDDTDESDSKPAAV